MVDVMSSSRRSALMSRIRAKNTTTERLVRSMLWRQGYRFRLHVKWLPGRPDIVLPKWHAVIFVNGCFWHAHDNCRLFRLPSTRTSLWREKLDSNRQRDARAIEALQLSGWRIAVIWECALRENLDAVPRELVNWIRQDSPYVQISGRQGCLVKEDSLPNYSSLHRSQLLRPAPVSR